MIQFFNSHDDIGMKLACLKYGKKPLVRDGREGGIEVKEKGGGSWVFQTDIPKAIINIQKVCIHYFLPKCGKECPITA